MNNKKDMNLNVDEQGEDASAAHPTMLTTITSTAQTAQLQDTEVNREVDLISQPSTKAMAAAVYDTDSRTIANQLEKEVNLITIPWSQSEVAGSVLRVLKLPQLFRFNPHRMVLNNYAYFNADMVFRIQLNGTSFYQGKAYVVYIPVEQIPISRQRISILPHVEIDANTSVNQEFRIKYNHVYPMIELADIGDAFTSNRFGFLYVVVFNPLVSGVSSQDLTLTIYGRFENAEVRNPRPRNTFFGPLSETAIEQGHIRNAVTGGVGWLYDQLTNLLPEAWKWVGNLDHPCVADEKCKKVTFSDTTHGNGGTTSTRLNLNQHTREIMPMLAVASEQDEMNALLLAQRPGFLQTISWDTTQVSGTVLFDVAVNPGKFNTIAFPGDITPCNLEYIASAYQFWRGSINMHIEFICTDFHRGRILVVYTPDQTIVPISTLEQARPYPQWILDIHGSRSYDINIPYYAIEPYKRVTPFFFAPLLNATDESSGRVTFFILNTLATGTTSVSNSIEFNIKLSAGKDFELKYPTDNFFNVNGPIQLDTFIDPISNDVAIEQSHIQHTSDQQSSLILPAEDGVKLSEATKSPMLAEDHHNLQELLRRPFMSQVFPKTDIPVTAEWTRIAVVPARPTFVDRTDTAEIDNFYDYFAFAYQFWRGSQRFHFLTTAGQADHLLVGIKMATRKSSRLSLTQATQQFQTNSFSKVFQVGFESAEFTLPWLTTKLKCLLRTYVSDLADTNFSRAPEYVPGSFEIWVRGEGVVAGTQPLSLELLVSNADETRFMYYLGPPPFLAVQP